MATDIDGVAAPMGGHVGPTDAEAVTFEEIAECLTISCVELGLVTAKLGRLQASLEGGQGGQSRQRLCHQQREVNALLEKLQPLVNAYLPAPNRLKDDTE